MKKLLVIAIALFGFSAVSFGQNIATTTATASANIIKPITIKNTVALSFGNIASGAAGTVVLSPASSPTRTPSDGIKLPAINGTVSAASFEIGGEGGSAYTFSFPSASTTIKIGTDGATMTVDNFTTDLSALGDGLIDATSGKQVVLVGATLNMAENQAAGAYTGSFEVKVSYN